jgi:molecular chaperone DnaJ
MPVPLSVAVLGGKAEVRTLEGPPVTLTVPPGTSSGKKLRLRGKGAHTNKEHRGDLYANVSIQLPSLSGANAERADELLTELAKLGKS